MALYTKRPDVIEAWEIGSKPEPTWVQTMIDEGQIIEKITPDGRKYVKVSTNLGYEYPEVGHYIIYNAPEDGGVYTMDKVKFDKLYRIGGQ